MTLRPGWFHPHPELDELDEDEREPHELPDAGVVCRFCNRVLDDCECVVETQLRCARCLGTVWRETGSDGLPRYRCPAHGNTRVRRVDVHYPRGWERLDDVQYEERPKLFSD